MSVRALETPQLASVVDEPMRALALLSTLGLIGAYVSVLYGLVDVAGNTTHFTVALVGSIVAATVLAHLVRARVALAIATGLLVAGLGWYLVSLSHTPRALPLVQSNLELLSGQSLHQIRESGIWAVGVTPAPVLVTWYLALRRWYATGTVVGGAMLGYVVLTGDASTLVTILGVVGAAGTFGFGDLDRRSGTTAGAEHVAVVLAIMVVVPLAVSVVPGGIGSPLAFDRSQPSTMESNLLTDQRELTVSGQVNLSPDVRFTIDSRVATYWKTNSFDRYTGTGWIRSGGTVPLEETRLPFPSGPRRTVQQMIQTESRLTSLPAAWRPVGVDETIAGRTAVTEEGDITATGSLAAGETYRVTSAVPADWRDRLQQTGTDYPSDIRERYTRLPQSTPDRVAARTATITSDADGPYETARTIETWLEANRGYSLNVSKPDDDIADAFLFEMEAGYCTYFATTMVVMLRSEDIPARLATGYTTGQQVNEDRYVVRGLDAHAWVEVYMEDHGWVRFDPTPTAPRERQENARVRTARQNNVSTVDTDESVGRPPGSSPTHRPEGNLTRVDPALNDTRLPENIDDPLSALENESEDLPGGGASPLVDLPTREHLVLGFVVIVGAVAGLRRTGTGRWLRRTMTVQWQPRVDPVTDVERAYRRVSILVERHHRPRRPGETVREYIDDVDPPRQARRVAAIRERVRYGEEVDADLADEAVRLADALRDDYDSSNRTPRSPEW